MIKWVTSFFNKWSGTQFYHDWNPIKSIIDILHKNFKEDNTNSRRFPGGFLNSSRFPGFPGVVDTLYIVTQDIDVRDIDGIVREFVTGGFQNA